MARFECGSPEKSTLARAIAGIALLVTTISSIAGAQTPAAWSLDVSAGAGQHTTRTGSVYWDDDATGTAWLALSRQFLADNRIAPYAQVEYRPQLLSGTKAVCIVVPNGGCRATYLTERGAALSAGARATIVPRVGIRLGAGVARVERATHTFGESDLALTLTRYVALRGGIRYERWQTSDGPFWFAPVTAGVRLLW